MICGSFEFRSNYGKSDDFKIEEPWKICDLICKAPNQKNEMGNQCWLTGLVNLKFAPIFI